MDGLYIMETLSKWMIWGYHYLRKPPYRESCAWIVLSLNLYDVASVDRFQTINIWKKRTCGSDICNFPCFPKRVFPNDSERCREKRKVKSVTHILSMMKKLMDSPSRWVCRLSFMDFFVAIDPFNQPSHLRWYSWHLSVFTFHIYQHGATIHTGNRAVIAMLETMKVTDQSVKFDDMLNLLYVQGFGALISWY